MVHLPGGFTVGEVFSLYDYNFLFQYFRTFSIFAPDYGKEIISYEIHPCGFKEALGWS